MDLKGYNIEKEIQKGGMGAVYLATDTKLNRKVAIKVLLAQTKQKKENVQRFIAEARAMAKISHPNIITLYDFGHIGEDPFLVMEFFAGNELGSFLRQNIYSVYEVLQIIEGTAEGLQAVHSAGIIHRDIKPSNIMVNDQLHAKIIDFGITKEIVEGVEAASPELTATGKFVGTMQYTAPEVISGGDASFAVDVYSLGLTLVKLLIGENPFYNAQDGVLVDKILQGDFEFTEEQDNYISEPIQQLIFKAINRRVVDRLPTMTDFLFQLRDARRIMQPEFYYFPYYRFVRATNLAQLVEAVGENDSNRLMARSTIGLAAMYQAYGPDFRFDTKLEPDPVPRTVNVDAENLQKAIKYFQRWQDRMRQQATSIGNIIMQEETHAIVEVNDEVAAELAEEANAEKLHQERQTVAGGKARRRGTADEVDIEEIEDEDAESPKEAARRRLKETADMYGLVDVENVEDGSATDLDGPVEVTTKIAATGNTSPGNTSLRNNHVMPSKAEGFSKPAVKSAHVTDNKSMHAQHARQRAENQQRIVEQHNRINGYSLWFRLRQSNLFRFFMLVLIGVLVLLWFTGRIDNLLG